MTSTKYFLWEFYLDGKCAGFFIHHRSKWKIGILALISFCALLKVVFVTLNITWLLTKILPNHELQLGHSMIEPFIISSSLIQSQKFILRFHSIFVALCEPYRKWGDLQHVSPDWTTKKSFSSDTIQHRCWGSCMDEEDTNPVLGFVS